LTGKSQQASGMGGRRRHGGSPLHWIGGKRRRIMTMAIARPAPPPHALFLFPSIVDEPTPIVNGMRPCRLIWGFHLLMVLW